MTLGMVTKHPSIGKVIAERLFQIRKGYVVENDVLNNSDEQLIHAVFLMIASLNDDNYSAVKSPPKNWQKDVWDKMLSKSKKEKLIIAATLLMAEYDRLIEVEKSEDKTFKQKSKWQKVT